MYANKRRLIAFLAVVALATGLSVAPSLADSGGGPGSNAGCAGHQPPPPPNGGCGK
jgi:hypothetical protein